MNGTITKYRKKEGRISWGFHYKAEGRQFSKSGFVTKFEASKALGAALGRHQDANGVARKSDTRTLAEYLDYWLDNHAALRCQPKTLERYRQLADYLIRLLGHISIPRLETSRNPGSRQLAATPRRRGYQCSSARAATNRQDRPLHRIVSFRRAYVTRTEGG